MTSKSDGSTASYYELPADATELQHLISHRDMNAQIGEVFRACYRYGHVEHSEKLRDAKKIRFYAQAEIDRLEKMQSIENNPERVRIYERDAIKSPGDLARGCGRQFEPASEIDDESPRQKIIQQGGELAVEVYAALDTAEAIALGAAPQREPCQPRHRCLACAGGHATHECGSDS